MISLAFLFGLIVLLLTNRITQIIALALIGVLFNPITMFIIVFIINVMHKKGH